MLLNVPASPEAPRHDFASVTVAQWRALGAKRLYFGHQSVGFNIADGLAAILAERSDIPLRIVEVTATDSLAAPGLYHGRVGRNGAPDSKTSDFTTMVDRATPGVAMLKYCYVDVEERSNPDSLFATYQRAAAALRSRHPGLVLVHATMPLTTIDDHSGRRAKLMAKLRGRMNEGERLRALNQIRNRYNALLRQAYVGTEPVFDVARLESTRPDGSRAFFVNGTDTIYIMAAENTDDGGYLNTRTRRVAAEEFLALLARI